MADQVENGGVFICALIVGELASEIPNQAAEKVNSYCVAKDDDEKSAKFELFEVSFKDPLWSF